MFAAGIERYTPNIINLSNKLIMASSNEYLYSPAKSGSNKEKQT